MPLLPILLFVGLLAIIAGGAMVVTGYRRGQPFNLDVKPIGNGLVLEANAADAWNAMVKAAAVAGFELKPSGAAAAWRSVAQQAELLSSVGKYGDGGFAASVGYSPHQAGYAIDVANVSPGTASFNASLSRWLDANSEGFGWYRVGMRFSTQEPWHFEFKGAPTRASV